MAKIEKTTKVRSDDENSMTFYFPVDHPALEDQAKEFLFDCFYELDEGLMSWRPNHTATAHPSGSLSLHLAFSLSNETEFTFPDAVIFIAPGELNVASPVTRRKRNKGFFFLVNGNRNQFVYQMN